MVPIPAGEGVDSFWMAATETTWDLYQLYQLGGPALPDGTTGPTTPYVPMDFNMGVEGYPAISMTHYAARQYCRWLTEKTGVFHRLPTGAEWKHACAAGTTSRWSFGEDPAKLTDYAWYYDNANDQYQPVGQKLPNPWGLYDMHGNVGEWTEDPFGALPREWGHAVRGGSWDDDPSDTTTDSVRESVPAWKMQDPQIPTSIWYLTDAQFLGFRVIRPKIPPPNEKWARYWSAGIEDIEAIHDRQQNGGR